MHFDDASPSNDSANPHLDDLAAGGSARRRFLQQATTAALIAGTPMLVRSAGVHAQAPLAPGGDPIPFRSVPVGTADTVVVPDGYRVQVLFAWGDPVGAGPDFRQDATNSADDQARQAGMHHDGMHFFPRVEREADGRVRESSGRGLLVVNHEYTDDGLLHAGGMTPWTAEKVAKSQNAHGVSVVEIELRGDAW